MAFAKYKLWNKRTVTITEYDPTYKVVYLGNVVTQYAKGDGGVDKPLATLWKNYNSGGNARREITMKVTITNSGLKATTREHGLTEYWSNRLTFCSAPRQYPRVFCWIYRHEGRRMRQELRCHAVLCDREDRAKTMAEQLHHRLTQALQEFRREKLCKQKARLSLVNPSLPRRKILLSTGSTNFRPPLDKSKSAPKLTAIDETEEEAEQSDCSFCEEDYELESDSLSDTQHYGLETDSLDSDSVDEVPQTSLRSRPLRLINEETVDEEEDSVSDESGYAEEKGSYKDEVVVLTYRM